MTQSGFQGYDACPFVSGLGSYQAEIQARLKIDHKNSWTLKGLGDNQTWSKKSWGDGFESFLEVVADLQMFCKGTGAVSWSWL